MIRDYRGASVKGYFPKEFLTLLPMEKVVRITTRESISYPNEINIYAEDEYGYAYYLDMDIRVYDSFFAKGMPISQNDKKLDKHPTKMVQLSNRKLRFD